MTCAVFDLSVPIVGAPMAGGPTTPALVGAVCAAGGLGFLPGGYRSAEELATDIAAVRLLTDRFGVNLFVPGAGDLDLTAFRAYARALQPEAEAYHLRLDDEPVRDDDGWADKLAMLVHDPVPVVSFTFGLPDAGDVAALRRAGSLVLATVTTPAEASAAHERGVDALVVQGASAGGHSGTHDPHRLPALLPTHVLVRQVRAQVDLPVIAAGGVDGPGSVRELLEAGAEAVAVGTLLLLADEAGTSVAHRAALTDPSFTATAITRAFTGRPARALRNGFMDRHDAMAPAAYPAVHHLTRALRRAASEAGDLDRVHLWAGTGFRQAVPEPAADTVRRLAG
ncbi:MAG: NAD(P)H-dependent flavin oxidoreductase [Actinomycetales bacterium]